MDSHFQVAILGTGLTESIAAASLAKAGVKVVHIDSNTYYGASEASLTTDELRKWVEDIQYGYHVGYSSASFVGDVRDMPRSYALSISPSVIVSTGPFISSLINSGVSRYGGFKLLENVSVYTSGAFKRVPASKEEIFKSKSLSLLDKRKLMRFLMFAASDFDKSNELEANTNKPFPVFLQDAFSIDKQLASTLSYALAFCENETDSTETVLRRLRQYLRSAGRYGPSAFLVGQYGGLGELTQGFCRICAVSGGIYILGRDIVSVNMRSTPETKSDEKQSFVLNLDGIPEALTADVVITSPALLRKLSLGQECDDMLPITHEVNGIVVLDAPVLSLKTANPGDSLGEAQENSETGENGRPLDSALLIFPPEDESSRAKHGPVSALINGEGILSCPPGKTVLYLTTTPLDNRSEELAINPEQLLQPYLAKVLQCLEWPEHSQPKELLSAYFARARVSHLPSSLSSLKEQRILICPDLTKHIADAGDIAVVQAEALFRQALGCLGLTDSEIPFWSPLPFADNEDLVE